jgi:hypothetical protein
MKDLKIKGPNGVVIDVTERAYERIYRGYGFKIVEERSNGQEQGQGPVTTEPQETGADGGSNQAGADATQTGEGVDDDSKKKLTPEGYKDAVRSGANVKAKLTEYGIEFVDDAPFAELKQKLVDYLTSQDLLP